MASRGPQSRQAGKGIAMRHATHDVEAFLADLRAKDKAKRLVARRADPRFEALEQRRLMTASVYVAGNPMGGHGNEGDAITFTLTPTLDAGTVFNHWSVSWGDGTTATFTGNETATVSHVYADQVTSTISACVYFDDYYANPAGSAVASSSVQADNVDPVATFTAAPTAYIGDDFVLHRSTYDDPGADTCTAVWINWGDDPDHPGFGGASSYPYGADFTHAYGAEGNCRISTWVQDEEGTYSQNTCDVAAAKGRRFKILGNGVGHTADAGPHCIVQLQVLKKLGEGPVGAGVTVEVWMSAADWASIQTANGNPVADGSGNYTATFTTDNDGKIEFTLDSQFAGQFKTCELYFSADNTDPLNTTFSTNSPDPN